MKKLQTKSDRVEVNNSIQHCEGPKEKSIQIYPHHEHSIPDGLHRYNSLQHEESDHKTSKSFFNCKY